METVIGCARAALACAVMAAALLAGCGGDDDPAPPPSVIAGDCASLARFKPSIDTTVTAAESIVASAAAPWTTPTNLFAPTGVQVTTPLCRVAGSIKPTAQSNIQFEVWMPPTRAGWNGKFFGTAAGGSTGVILYSALTNPLQRGYAAMGHDNGHASTSSFEQSWAFDTATSTVKTELITDFGHRAQHVATVVGKEFANAFYGSTPARSYYNGCSQGGHHGMMEVQRYPEDYDGIVAGAHGGDWIGMMSSEAYSAIAVVKNARAGGLTTPQQGALNAAVLGSCDANDGVVDGLIQNPPSCQFDPAVLQCGAAGADPATCLSAAQVQATREVWTGPRRLDGQSVSPGYSIGSEIFWNQTWNATTVLQSGSYYDFFRLILKKDPNFDILTINFDSDVDAGRAEFGPIYNAISPDLSRFKARNGKLIMYHGWADPLIAAQLSVDSWRRIQDSMGAASTGEFARLFMVPGMGHCSGGSASNADWLTALEKWVEQGVAPDATSANNTIIGSGTIGGAARTRPLCPYPQVQKYKGSGDINAAENFTCGLP
jgi:feruloyl esterase